MTVKDQSYTDVSNNLGSSGADKEITISIDQIKPNGTGSQITGTTEPNQTVTITMKDGKPVGIVKSDENGNWTLTTTEPLKDGDAIVATTPNQDKNTVADEAPLPFVSIDHVASDDIINEEEITSLTDGDGNIEITGTVSNPDADMTVTFNGKTYSSTSSDPTLKVTVNSDGTWSIKVPVTEIQLDQPNSIKASGVVVTPDGDEIYSNDADRLVGFDDTPPKLTIDVPANTNDNTPTISGTTDEPVGSIVEITITGKDGSTQTVTTVVKEGATYEVDVPTALPDGEFSVTAKVTDLAGNTTTATDKGTIDTVLPGVSVEITPDGDIKVTFDPDVDPETIDPESFVITDKDGNPIELELTPDEGGLTWTGKVPEDVEGKVTVEVPEGSYKDTSGNSGKPGTDNENVNMVPPGVTVEITPEGDIKVTFDPDVDPSTITPDDIKITDKDGNLIELELTPDEGGLTWTGKVPEDVEGKVTVEVPEGSYKDTSGNSGKLGTGNENVNMVPPQVEVIVGEDGTITIKYPSDVDPDSISTDGITVEGPNGPIKITLIPSDDGLTFTGKVPEGIDGNIKVDVPAGSYEDTSGKPGTGTGEVDTDRPQVEVTVTPNGDIVLTYPDDTDPSTITTDKITVKDPTGKDIVVDFGTPVTQPDGSITVTGKVPEGTDSTITVTVPEGSYEDTTGNPGQPGTGTGEVDTDRPQVEVTVTPNGDIVLTYPDDTDPSSIITDKITVKDPTGKDIVVDFGTPVTQPDGSITVTGKVPEGVDGSITVIVPEGSYEDVTGNPGGEGQGTTTVDTVAPEVAVTVTSSSADHTSATATFTFTEKIDPATFSINDLIVSGGKVVGTLKQVDDFTWTVELKTEPGVTVEVEVKDDSYADIAGNTGTGDQDQLITIKITGVTPSTDASGGDVTVITGKTEPNSEVSVIVPGQDTPLKVTAGPDGLWELTVPGILKDGNEVSAKTTYEDKNGNLVSTGDEVELPFVYIDVLAGDDVINEQELADLTEIINGQEFITVTGTISNPSADLVVNFNGTSYSGTQVTITPQGQWSIRVPVEDVKDSNIVTAKATTDTATSNTASRNPGLDNEAPTVTVDITEQGLITIQYESDVNPSTVNFEDYTVVDQSGKKVTVEYTVSEDGLTVIGKITSPVDGQITVLVPKDSYQDLSGNNGTKGSASESVDTTPPTATVTITPQGDVIVSYEDDVDPTTIDPKDIVVKDSEGNEITVELTPSEDGLTYTGKVPEGIDGKITVEVPENSYEDLTGNSGKPATGEGEVDTDRPQVEVTVTPEGQIIVKYPEDTDPTSITTDKIVVKDPSGKEIVVELTPSEDGLTYTGKVPEGVDGTVTVDVPENSYEDLTGNPGKAGEGEGDVDTDRPSVEITLTPQGSIVIQYEDDVDPTTIDPKDIVITDQDGNPIKVELTVSPDGLTLTGQIPPNVDSKVTVIVPEGSYQDTTGNEGQYDIDSELIDTDVPEVTVTVDPQGNITVTYPDDTDPKTINPDAIVVKDPSGKEIVVELTPSEDGLAYTGKVPEGIDGKITVDVPAGSYEDLTGNPGTPNTGKYPVDTIAPTVEITLTPTGDIVVKFDDDVDPTTIDPKDILITDKNGNPVEVTLTPSEDGLTYTGKVPSGVDEQITVEVPTGSYTDLVGNPGLTDKETVDVDTIAPTVTVDIISQGTDTKATATFEFSEKIDPASFSSADLKVTGGQIVGQPIYNEKTGQWSVELKVEPGQTVTVEVLPESYTDEAGNKGSGDSDRLITVNITDVTPNTTEDGTHVTVITGKTEPGHDVVVTLPDGTELPPVKAGPDGTWTTTTELPLKDGDDLSASTTDQDGNPTQDTVSLPLISIDVIAGDDVINEEELAELTDENGDFIITGTISNPTAEITVNINGKPYTVNPADITPTGQWTLKVPANEIQSKNTITAVGKTDTVTSEPAIRNPDLDNDAPTVQVEITPQGEIKVTFAPDVDPATIDPKDFVITDLEGNPVVVDFTPSEDRLTYTGQVPTGVDTSITVKVPEASYTDKAGNLGEEGSKTVEIDTTAPVVDIQIDENGKITLTYPEDTDPDTIDTTGVIVEGPDGEVIPGVSFEKQPDGTFIAKVPEGIDGDIVVKVPEGSYQDTTGNSGEPVNKQGSVDTEAPVVDVQIDENGKITLTYPDDVDPSTITEDKIVVEGPNGPIEVLFTPPVKQPDGSYVVTGEVPEGTDGEIVVKVPAGSYEDTTGNSGEPVEQHGIVDTDTPTAEVTITPDGKITVTYPDDVDPSTITEDKIVVEGPDGLIEVPFTPPVKQPDGSYVVTGEVPEGTDGEIVVKVPAGSYEDTTGNSGEPVDQPGIVDTDTPTAEVTITPDGKITVTYPDDVDPSTITEDKIVVEGPNGPIEVPFTPPVKQPDGSYVVTGEVPEGTDGEIVVKVPAGSYEDTTGNSGEPVEKQGTIDTEAPTAEVTIEPNGEIVVKYSPDADKTTIDPADIVVKDSEGNTIVVDFVPSDDGLTYTGKVPTAIDENITVTVPENSFKDTTGNDNTTSVKTDPVDTIAPQVEVVITPEGQITLKYEDDVVPSTIDTSKIVIVDGNGKSVPVTFTPSEDGLTLVGQVPDGIDSNVTVTVPSGSYEDEVGNRGGKGSNTQSVDTQSPEVEISITPDGKITVTYPDDVDPSTITEDKIIVEGPDGLIEVPFTPPVKQPDGSYVVTGEVPPGVDGDVTVTVPTDSYEDESGNPGEGVTTIETPVDTIPPKVEVTITPDGKITVTYPDDVDPSTITEDKIVVEGPNGPIEVPFTPPVKQPDGSYVVTGEVPEGTDGEIVVKVPAGSYEDTTGNSGEPVEKPGTIDTEAPTAEVTIEPNGDIVIKYPNDTNPDSIDTSKITITDKDGDPVVVDLTPSADGKTFTGKVPNGNDTDITVSIPTGSYTDLTGNPGTPVEVTKPVDTIAPTVDIEITPNGQITLTYEDDTVSSTIQTGKITVTDKSGNPIVVEFVPSQDDPLVLVGRVPEGTETEIVVTVPAGSYQDEVGNKGTLGKDSADIDAVPPVAEVTITPDGKITVTYPDDVDPDSIKTDGITVDGPNGPIEIPFTPDEDGLTWTGKIPSDVEGEVTVKVPEGSYEDTSGNPGKPGAGTENINMVPPGVTIELEESNLDDPVITIKFTEVPCGPDGQPLSAEQIKTLVQAEGFDFDSELESLDGGLTWTAPVTYTGGDVSAVISDDSYYDAAGNKGSGDFDELKAPVIELDTPTVSIPVKGGSGANTNTFTNGNLRSDKVHSLNVGLKGVEGEFVRAVINLDTVDNSFGLNVNGKSLTSGKVIQLQNNDGTHTNNQVFLKTASGEIFGDVDTTKPWNKNENGLPRIQIIVTEDGIRFFGTLTTTSTELVELFLADPTVLQLPDFKDGNNTIDIINYNGTGDDGMSGSLNVYSGESFQLSDEDNQGELYSKVVVKLTEGEGVVMTPVLPKGMIAEFSPDGKSLTLKATDGTFLSAKDFEDALQNLIFKASTDGQRKFEITVYDEDGVPSEPITTTTNYDDASGRVPLDTSTVDATTTPTAPTLEIDIHSYTEISSNGDLLGGREWNGNSFDGAWKVNNPGNISDMKGAIGFDADGGSVVVSQTINTALPENAQLLIDLGWNNGWVGDSGSATTATFSFAGIDILKVETAAAKAGSLNYVDGKNILTDDVLDAKVTVMNGATITVNGVTYKEGETFILKTWAQVLEDTNYRNDAEYMSSRWTSIAIDLPASLQGKTGDLAVSLVGGQDDIQIGALKVVTPNSNEFVTVDSNVPTKVFSSISINDADNDIRQVQLTLSDSTTSKLAVQQGLLIDYFDVVFENGTLTISEKAGVSASLDDWNSILSSTSYFSTTANMNSINVVVTDAEGLTASKVVDINSDVAVAARFSLLNLDNDVIFDLLADDNLGGNTETVVDELTLGDTNDVIDISSLLSDDAMDSNLAEFVTVEYDAENDQAVISIDRDGTGTDYESQNLVVLLNQPNKVELDDLINNNQIIY